MKLLVLVKEGKWSILGSLIWHKIDGSSVGHTKVIPAVDR